MDKFQHPARPTKPHHGVLCTGMSGPFPSLLHLVRATKVPRYMQDSPVNSFGKFATSGTPLRY